ncbi:unnamed protein product [Pylaiella littoralis]
MADTIARFRGGSAGRPAATSAPLTKEGPETREDAGERRPRLKETPSWRTSKISAMNSDPFQCGGCNGDKLRREATRKQDLLVHARTRDNGFCRRKGYEPGDFLKRRPPPVVSGGVAGSAATSGGGSGSRKGSARSAAAATAEAASRRRAQRQRRVAG